MAAFGGQAADGSTELVWDATKHDASTFPQFMTAVVPSDVLYNYKVNWIRINVKHPQRTPGELSQLWAAAYRVG